MSLQSLRRGLCRRHWPIITLSKNTCREKSSAHYETDSCAIPIHPTWSVNQLLSSYPSPKLSGPTIDRLYQLSALVAPKEGSPQHEAMSKDLEDMVRLVEAVRLVDTSGTVIAARGEEDVDRQTFDVVDSGEYGQKLLKHASHTTDQFYIVDSDKRRSS